MDLHVTPSAALTAFEDAYREALGVGDAVARRYADDLRALARHHALLPVEGLVGRDPPTRREAEAYAAGLRRLGSPMTGAERDAVEARARHDGLTVARDGASPPEPATLAEAAEAEAAVRRRLEATQAEALAAGVLPVWTAYGPGGPAGPDLWALVMSGVARDGAPAAPGEGATVRCGSFGQVGRVVPRGLSWFPRSPSDDPTILGCWI